MALKIQIVVMDSKDYIIEYKDFGYHHQDEMNAYIWKWVTNPTAFKIHIRKW